MFFTVLRGMPAQTSYEKGVCLSVWQTCDLWQNKRKLCTQSYTTSKTI